MPSSNLPPPSRSPALAVEFFKRLGLILGASLGVVAVVALALGQFHLFGLSNLLFWASLVVMGVAVLPALSEFGCGFTVLGRSLTNRDNSLKAMMAELRDRRNQGLNNSVLFGTAGIIIFVLSFVFATLFSTR